MEFVNTGISAATVFIQGILSFFSPCTLPLVPLYISYLAGGGKRIGGDGRIYYPRKTVLLNTIGFVLGISFTFFLLGLGFSALGQFFGKNKNIFSIISGIIMILFGVYQLGVFKRFAKAERERRFSFDFSKWTMNPVTAWVLGFTFSFAWTPCVGPVLSSVLLMASSAGSGASGFLLIAVYTLGFIIPFLAVGIFTGTVLDFFKKHQSVVRYTVKIGGALLILMGLMTITGFMNGVNSYFSSIAKEQSETSSMPSASASASAGGAAENTKEPEEEKRTQIPAPDFEIADQYGNIHRLSDYKGKVVFINFWTTWCGYCKQEMPDIQKLYEEYGQNSGDVVILGAANPKTAENPRNADEDIDTVKKFISDGGYTFPVLIDTEGVLFSGFGISSFPTTFFIDRDGNVLWYVPGAAGIDMMRQAIEEAIAS